MRPNDISDAVSLRLATAYFSLMVAAIVLTGCAKTPGGPDHAQDEPPTTSVTLAAEKLELFMEHPYLVQGQEAKFNVHLTVLKDGMPIRSGRLKVVVTGPSGKTVTVEQAAPRSPGIYGPVIAFPEAGNNEMELALHSDQAVATIRVPVTVYPDPASANKAAVAAGEEPEGKITFLKEQAWKIGLRTEAVAERRLVERLSVPGQIVPRAGGKAVVTPPAAGRVSPPRDGAFPQVGQRVEAGTILAVIEPVLAGPTGVGIQANRAQVQALDTDLAARFRELEVETTKAKIDLDYAQRAVERLRGLSDAGSIPGKRFDEAQREYEIAKANYEGKQRACQQCAAAREDLLKMLREKPAAQPGQPLDAQAASSPYTAHVVLAAPVSGTVTAADCTAGEYVDGTRSLLTIINLDRVWIEAKVSEYDLDRVTKAPAANFSLAAYPGRHFTILGRDGGRLIDVGSVVDPDSRTVTLRYEVANPDRLFRIGMFADVDIETTRTEKVLALPESAIVDEDGRPIVYVQVEGESYQKRDVELGIRDSGFVEVKQGLKEKERVVTQGAYAIRLSSVSSVIPAHGHVH